MKDTEPHPAQAAVLRILSNSFGAGRVILGVVCHNQTKPQTSIKEKTLKSGLI